jgi:hypothetical protein
VLQTHPDTVLVLDEAAAARLDRAGLQSRDLASAAQA